VRFGGGGGFTALCAELGISRQTFYKWRRRYEVRKAWWGWRNGFPRRPASVPRDDPGGCWRMRSVRLRKNAAVGERGADDRLSPRSGAVWGGFRRWPRSTRANCGRPGSGGGPAPKKRPRSVVGRASSIHDPNGGVADRRPRKWHLARDVPEVGIMGHPQMTTPAHHQLLPRACRGPDTERPPLGRPSTAGGGPPGVPGLPPLR